MFVFLVHAASDVCCVYAYAYAVRLSRNKKRMNSLYRRETEERIRPLEIYFASAVPQNNTRLHKFFPNRI